MCFQRRLLIAAALAATVGASGASAQIGKVAAVNQRMDGTRPTEDRRQLFLKDDIVSNERVQTTEDGSGQLLFVDQTSLTVAPSSDIVLDKYIFDPDRQAGDMALSLTKGAVRFIGGAITKSNEATIRTPTSTIGIRGGMVIVQHEAGQTTVTNVASISVTITTYGDADGDGLDDGPSGGAGDSGDTGGTTDTSTGDTGTTGVGTGETGAGSTGTPDAGTASPGGTTPPANPITPVSAPATVTLTRPSSTAVSDENGVTYTGVTNIAALTEIFGEFEGSGSGGFPSAPDSSTTEQGTNQVASNNSGQTGGATNTPVTTTGANQNTNQDPPPEDPNANNQVLNDPPPPADAFAPMLLPADPAAIATLTGTAVYFGTADGTLTDLTGVNAPVAVTGTSAVVFDFANRQGVLQLDLSNGLFLLQANALQGNAAAFQGSDPVFGGPNSFSATGTFQSSQGATTPDEIAAAIDGTFNLDLTEQNQNVNGTYEAGVVPQQQ